MSFCPLFFLCVNSPAGLFAFLQSDRISTKKMTFLWSAASGVRHTKHFPLIFWRRINVETQKLLWNVSISILKVFASVLRKKDSATSFSKKDTAYSLLLLFSQNAKFPDIKIWSAPHITCAPRLHFSNLFWIKNL